MKKNNSFSKAVYVVGKIFAVFLIVAITVGIIQGLFTAFSDRGVIELNSKKDDESSHSSQEYVYDIGGYCLVAELKGTDVTVNSGDKFEYKTNNKNVKVTHQNDKIIIKETKNTKAQLTSKLELTIPSDKSFSLVDISCGAGNVTINGLNTNDLNFELGAGDVTVNDLVVTNSADIDCGAGSLNINGGSINDLELDCGVGEISVSAVFTGECEVNSGIGEVDINALGSMNDYSVFVDKVAGEVKVNGKSVLSGNKIGNGKAKIEINGGLGEINVFFGDSQK